MVVFDGQRPFGTSTALKKTQLLNINLDFIIRFAHLAWITPMPFVGAAQ
ncbi:MAG: hypothetical protein ABSF14_02190 [Terriglobia bacterium]